MQLGAVTDMNFVSALLCNTQAQTVKMWREIVTLYLLTCRRNEKWPKTTGPICKLTIPYLCVRQEKRNWIDESDMGKSSGFRV